MENLLLLLFSAVAAAAAVVGPASSFHLTKVRGRKSQAVHRKTYSQLHVIL